MLLHKQTGWSWKAKAAAQIQLEEKKLEAQDQREGVRMGIDAMKEKEKIDLQRKQAALQHMQSVRQSSKKPEQKEKPKK